MNEDRWMNVVYSTDDYSNNYILCCELTSYWMEIDRLMNVSSSNNYSNNDIPCYALMIYWIKIDKWLHTQERQLLYY